MPIREPELAARQRLSDLFTAHHAELLAYARRRGAREADAEEVVAETFVVAWRRMGQLTEGAERAWLYGIARRVVANQQRGWNRRQQRTGPMPESVASASIASGLDADLQRVLERLRTADRELLELAAWEELEPADLAVLLDITPNAAAIRLHRARQRFIDAMIELSESDPALKGSPWLRTFRWVKGSLARSRREKDQ
jgi:RNA polymerase sigma-70 factor (ECF subfamily)